MEKSLMGKGEAAKGEVQGSGFWVKGVGPKGEVLGSGFRVQGSGLIVFAI